MLHIRQHTKADYAVLPDIDLSPVGTLDANDRNCLDEAGALLVARRANDRFGITLLHSHFPISDDELLIEQPERDKHSFTLRPVEECSAHADDLVPINLQFDSADGALTLIGLEFIRSGVLADILPVCASDAPVLNELKEILVRRDCLGRFGISLLHDAIGLGERDILLETCDLRSRTLHCVAARRDDQRVSNGVETTWSWLARSGIAETDPQATRLCRRQCTRICLTPEGGSHQSGGHEPSGHERGDD